MISNNYLRTDITSGDSKISALIAEFYFKYKTEPFDKLTFLYLVFHSIMYWYILGYQDIFFTHSGYGGYKW